MQPWAVAKEIKRMSDDHEPSQSLELLQMQTLINRTIYLVAETLRNMGILLQPFMPEKAGEMLDVLGVCVTKRTFDHVGLGKDFSYGEPKRSVGRGAHEAMFPPLEVEA